ncbi:hypothetical protein [Umezawaea sp.]|uniref:hypothetical protein n=1 Tax=Umezawaea sp. TaxID=1955258 RepID=UPI002ED03119
MTPLPPEDAVLDSLTGAHAHLAESGGRAFVIARTPGAAAPVHARAGTMGP